MMFDRPPMPLAEPFRTTIINNMTLVVTSWTEYYYVSFGKYFVNCIEIAVFLYKEI